ncbi:SDR family NAD(P)-dependent oxidoreductase [Nonomuraea guangzhouensis]|uniref:SDR family NAD(P)-dependent oxidoreductase n=1 Tax=Nonomuraea guangzhouensis TaxID=1291555 RepID=A0ABW4G2P0_9ACTN|nr:SDR family NAD(P)-dependent oxidoreductase [Nonomuraea guangzhouensis]
MRTIVISGGTDGIGRALALHYLRAGETVVIIGRSAAKADAIRAEADVPAGRLRFLRADLALARESERVAAEIAAEFPSVDALIMCAAYVSTRRHETAEGVEHTFALFYLSRYILTIGLADRLRAAPRPIVVNVSVPGAPRDAIQWDDLGLRSGFTSLKANRQARRANELIATCFPEITYVLYNPGYVETSFAGDFNRPTRAIMGLLGRLAATPPAKAIAPVVDLVDQPPAAPVSAFKGRKEIARPVDPADALKLQEGTARLLAELGIPSDV